VCLPCTSLHSKEVTMARNVFPIWCLIALFTSFLSPTFAANCDIKCRERKEIGNAASEVLPKMCFQFEFKECAGCVIVNQLGCLVDPNDANTNKTCKADPSKPQRHKMCDPNTCTLKCDPTKAKLQEAACTAFLTELEPSSFARFVGACTGPPPGSE
jgi:hypothetical protein